MAEALRHDENNTLRVLLVGHTGHGKSSTGNSLLGYKRKDKRGFVSKKSLHSVTTKAESRVEKRFGYRLEVVDCPGFGDTSGSDELIKKEIGKAIFWTLPGFHCIAFVLRPDRISESIANTIESFFGFFGKHVGAYACLILTHVADDEEMNEYLDSANQVESEEFENLKKLIGLCQGKAFALENTDDDRESQAKHILKKIDRMKTKNRQPYFTNEMLDDAMEAIDKRERRRKQKIEEKEQKQERQEQGRKDELRKLQEEKERIKEKAASKKEKLRLIEEMNSRYMDLKMNFEREKEMHQFELQKLKLEMDREREERMDEMRRDREEHEERFDQVYSTHDESESSSGCIII